MPTSQTSQTALDGMLKWCSRRFGSRLRVDDASRQNAANDESGWPGVAPAAVLSPTCADEIAALAREAALRGVGLVPRGAGTGKAGGCIPRTCDIVVDMTRMNRIRALHAPDLYAIVEPGVVTATLDAEAGQACLMYPPDPASAESCTIGGNIATNAGGPRAVKYGVTQRYVWGLTVVLPGGDVLHTGRRSIKGVAGYDLTSLMVGSEGTLGFIAEAVIHLIPAPRSVQTAWLSFTSPAAASAAAERVLTGGITPRMLELLDRVALDAVRAKSPFRIPDGAGAALLVETDGSNDAQTEAELQRLCELACAAGATDSAIAASEKDREAMRRARKLVSSSLREAYPYKLSDDIAVPCSRMAELLDRAQSEAHKVGIAASAYGHLGDGNLHVNLLATNAAERALAQGVRDTLLRLAVSLGGTVSGEHGIGLAKRDVLPLEHAPDHLAWERRLKDLFDPTHIMNPGKVLATDAPIPTIPTESESKSES